MAAYTQDTRPIAITTVLGKDKLLLTEFTYSEEFNKCFEINAFVQSEDKSISLDALLGTAASICMKTAHGAKKRYFHGIIDNVTETERVPGLVKYTLTIVPWFAMLKMTSDCHIFQKKNVPDIVKEVLQTAGCPQAEFKITEDNYPKMEYCVQYLESSYDFICRLVESVGIAWYFKHAEGKHTLVFTDAVSKHEPTSGYESVPYREAREQGDVTESIYNWKYSGKNLTGAWAHTDFDFTNPQVVESKVPGGALASSMLKKLEHPEGEREWFDYPGGYADTGRGKTLATSRVEAAQAFHNKCEGEATAMGLVMGSLFKLKEHPRDDQNRDYLLTYVYVRYYAGPFGSAHDNSKAEEFSCHFTALDIKIPFRPEPRTRRPRIYGPQTAIVTGPTGGQAKGEEEIFTDEYGRVKVHFHWDRHLKYDQDSSCWVRVSQVWAGQGWGGMHIPRIGQEVIIEFLNGDPDCPIITGRVYNKHAMPPYGLPDKKNISGVRSKTNPAGAPTENFNEIYMDDTKGSELVHIQAEKDRTILVKHDNTEDVKHDEGITIGNDRTKHVKRNEDTTVDGNRTEEVKKNEDITIVGNRTEEVKKNEDITIGENRTEQVGKNEEVKIGKNRTHDVGEKDILIVRKELFIDVGEKITIQTGDSSITMKKDGTIQIKGKHISILGSGKISVKADGDVVVKGSNSADN